MESSLVLKVLENGMMEVLCSVAIERRIDCDMVLAVRHVDIVVADVNKNCCNNRLTPLSMLDTV